MILDNISCQTIGHYFADNAYLKHMLLKEGYSLQQHKHKFSHLSVLVNGSAFVEVNGQSTLHHGLAIISIEAGSSHSVTPVDGDCDWLCLHSCLNGLTEHDVDGELIQIAYG